jgi:hypothetical protein
LCCTYSTFFDTTTLMKHRRYLFMQEHIPSMISLHPLIFAQIYIFHNCNQHFFGKAFTVAMIYAFSLPQGHVYLYMSVGIRDDKCWLISAVNTRSLIVVQLLYCSYDPVSYEHSLNFLNCYNNFLILLNLFVLNYFGFSSCSLCSVSQIISHIYSSSNCKE